LPTAALELHPTSLEPELHMLAAALATEQAEPTVYWALVELVEAETKHCRGEPTLEVEEVEAPVQAALEL
jgi:hypothetical protein